MSTIALDHLRQHVRMEVKRHLEGSRHNRPWVALAYRGRPGWDGEQTFDERLKIERRDDRKTEERAFRFRAVSARSLLELRGHLASATSSAKTSQSVDPNIVERLVIVADLPQGQFPADIRARLLHADLREIDPWRVLMTEFKATKVDPRIKADQALALALLQQRPATGFPAVTTGVLDRATMWGCVCSQVLGLPSVDPTPREILAWSTDDAANTKLRAAPAGVRTAAQDWMAERSPLAAMLVTIASSVTASDLIPIGIVCGVIHHEESASQPDLLRAQGRLEQITGHQVVTLKDAREWCQEAMLVLAALDEPSQRKLRKRSDSLLAQVGADGFAYVSDVAPLGYEQRLIAFAQTLRGHLDRKVQDADLLAAAKAVRSHWDGRSDSHRQAKADMATRLARWLRSSSEPATRLPDAMRSYQDQLAFVDWARHGVVGGDLVPELQKAYAALHERVLARREAFNRSFAELTLEWNRSPDQFPEILRIEDINRRVVADVAADHKVLVLVMDGMSWPVAQELLGHLEQQYWTMRSRVIDGFAIPGPVMSTLPSVTEYARTSLLCGTLTRGDAGDERRGFAESHELRSVSSSSNPPVLFHRKDLEEPGRQGLSNQILTALGNQKQRIVGVVVNAVDDYLVKDDGGRRTWDLESIRVLGDLLAAAGSAKRAIVLCSDHGHVLDHWVAGSTGTPDGGERWHTASPRDGEVVVSGPRIAAYGSALTVPWTERVRYGIKKNGYHGGLTPQEVIPPCIVIAKLDDTIEGWAETHMTQPAWWRLDSETIPSVATATAGSVATAPTKTKSKRDDPNQQSLFDEPTVKAATTGAWPQRLIASSVYQQSSTQAGRRRPDDAQVLALLAILDAAPGHQVSERALAEALNVPVIRMSGIIAQVARMLNVEGYRILSYTDDRGHIRLDRQLAMTQFELGVSP